MRLYLFALFLSAVLLPSTSWAVAGDWQRDADIGVRLVSSVDGTGNNAEITLGLDIDMEAGWHTYWRSPGITGLPPHIDWGKSLSESGNLKSAALAYPVPVRIDEQGMETIGYNDDVLLPITARLRAPGKPLAISAALDLLICNKLCSLKHFTLKLDVPAGPATPSPEAPYIKTWQDRVPGDAGQFGIAITGVQRNPDDIYITFARYQSKIAPDIFVENGKNIAFAKPVLESGGADFASFILKPAGKLPAGVSLKTLPVTVTIVDGDDALEQKLDPAFDSPQPSRRAAAPLPGAPPSLWVFLILAVLGGFILNLTPCVLPVLSLKILSVISHGGGEKRVVRRSFLTTASGIVFSFLVLAGVAVLLKETGRAVGWGVQFQQPAFLVLLILLLTLFAANLWDVFEITLPRFLADRFDPLYHPKLAGDFFTGAFATLMATPCSVPFLGTATGFALAAGPVEILAVFLALGLGMALPYLAIALWPRLAILLPRPGHWMITLRRALGVALALTALWLLTVLRAEMALFGVIVVAGSMLAITAVLYGQKRWPQFRFGRAAIAVFVLLAFGAALGAITPPAEIERASGAAWVAFDEAAIARHVEEGKAVFLDVTADWCVNCKANKKFTLSRDDVSRCLFATPGVVAMRADWTNSNPAIGAFMRKHKRFGIPFNAVFGPGAPQGVVLPELLTPGAVFDGVAKALGKPSAC